MKRLTKVKNQNISKQLAPEDVSEDDNARYLNLLFTIRRGNF